MDRIDKSHGLKLFSNGSLKELKALSQKNRFNGPLSNDVTYVVDINPNYTNLCTCECEFCSFYVSPSSKRQFTLSISDLLKIIEKWRDKENISTILLQGGLHPDLPFSYYENLISSIKKNFPDITPHCFSAPEISHFADMENISVKSVLQRLWDVGLRSLPGGGAEILVDRVRKKIAPNKISSFEWLAIHREAHKIGYLTTATMMYGHGEEEEDIVEHLEKLRALQEETGGFTAFIPWSYKGKKWDHQYGRNKKEDYYRMISFARIYLDNFKHIQASWFSEGKEIGVGALSFGADDFGGTLFIENVHKSANFINQVSSVPEVKKMIEKQGFNPVERDVFYRPVGNYSEGKRYEKNVD